MQAWHVLSPGLSQHHRGVDACNLSSWEVVRKIRAQGHSGLYSECENSIAYLRFYQKVGGEGREKGREEKRREGKGRGEERRGRKGRGGQRRGRRGEGKKAKREYRGLYPGMQAGSVFENMQLTYDPAVLCTPGHLSQRNEGFHSRTGCEFYL